MLSRTEQFLDGAKISQTEIAEALRLDPSSVSRKISGERPWKLAEIQGLLAFLTERLDRRVTYEELFGSPSEPAVDLVDPVEKTA